MHEKIRWENYRKANDKFPEVRQNELKFMLRKINPKPADIILEAGTGNGYLTFPIAQNLAKGKIITYDIIKDNLSQVRKLNKKFKLPIIIKR